MSQIIFITGTDTDVGKTVATGLLLHNLRQRGIEALAVKPFCSGSLDDVRQLHGLQGGALSFEQTNPWFFRQALAPMVAARASRRKLPTLRDAAQYIEGVAKRGDVLLVEGSGGLLVPLGPRKATRAGHPQAGRKPAMQQSRNLRYRKQQMGQCYTIADLIKALDAAVLVVARNKLGTINHTLLTLRALPFFEAERVAVLLMDQKRPDLSAKTNPAVLRQLLEPVNVLSVPYLGPNPLGFSALEKNERILQKTVAKIFGSAIFSPLFGRKNRAGSGIKKALTALSESVDSTR